MIKSFRKKPNAVFVSELVAHLKKGGFSMDFTDLKYDRRHEKIGYLGELLKAGLILNSTLVILGDEYYVIGRNDVYLASRDAHKWILMGVFRRGTIFSRLPDGVNIATSMKASENDNEWFYAQLTIRSEDGLKDLIIEITGVISRFNGIDPKIKLFKIKE